MTVIMAVTANKYELPVAVEDDQHKMARCIGISEAAVSRAISRGSRLRTRSFGVPVRIVRVEIDEED